MSTIEVHLPGLGAQLLHYQQHLERVFLSINKLLRIQAMRKCTAHNTPRKSLDLTRDFLFVYLFTLPFTENCNIFALP